VARVPRGKQATVCEVGLLPSDDSLLAPEWVPWADRIRPEDVPQPEAPADGEDGDEEAAADDEAGGEPAAGESAEPPHGDDLRAAAIDQAPEEAPEDNHNPPG